MELFREIFLNHGILSYLEDYSREGDRLENSEDDSPHSLPRLLPPLYTLYRKRREMKVRALNPWTFSESSWETYCWGGSHPLSFLGFANLWRALDLVALTPLPRPLWDRWYGSRCSFCWCDHVWALDVLRPHVHVGERNENNSAFHLESSF